MQIEKLRITDANGLVPAGQYFKLVADALREANAREAREVRAPRKPQSRVLEVVQ
jgi:hypothetical protein